MKQIGKRLASLVAALAVAVSLCPLWGQEVEAMSAGTLSAMCRCPLRCSC